MAVEPLESAGRLIERSHLLAQERRPLIGLVGADRRHLRPHGQREPRLLRQ